MTAVAATIDVERPAAEVFAYAIDPSTFAEWQNGVVGGSTEGAGEVQVGDLCRTTRRVSFMVRTFTSKVEAVNPPVTWRVRGIDGPVRAAVDVTVERLGDSSSRLTITIEFSGAGIGRVLVPLVIVREARKEMPENLAALKRQLESATP